MVWLCAFDSLLVNAYERLIQAVLLVYNADVVLFLCIHSKTTHATKVCPCLALFLVFDSGHKDLVLKSFSPDDSRHEGFVFS